MWCIVIRQHDGTYIRETVEDCPDLEGLQYWEDYYKMDITKPNGSYHYSGHYVKAVVVNVFNLPEES